MRHIWSSASIEENILNAKIDGIHADCTCTCVLYYPTVHWERPFNLAAQLTLGLNFTFSDRDDYLASLASSL